MSHVRYANEPAVGEEGSAQRLCGLKMADEETRLGAAFSGASDMEEPAAKRSKIKQAPAEPGGDNNGLGLKPAVKLDDSAVLGTTEEDAVFLGHDDLPSNGLAVTPDHNNEDDDRSSHASSSDWAPRPQIGSYASSSNTSERQIRGPF
ncbi:hypothetical protein KUCAC02_023946 [Chaenocephalus aceratus]|uniref:Uncharacterized protein n=1 Tax=Chaenocephalus aceratus TaxID=36190 RepID=A0ACB9WI84_CHAAC|nr:hypothetical protein KUCAC02_023946 [Chaenocephalus aceratus]